jgi:ferredoxin
VAWRALASADAAMNRLYGWRCNPLYQSGALALALLGLVLATGVYLFLFYRIGAPYESVARITDQAWAGRWIRGVHRYASDAAVIAIAVHALRMLAQGRSWGRRALAWVSGLLLLFLVFVCGWTGYVMVWDVQAQVLALEGARLLDALPIFSEPIVRTFGGARPMPGAFFFLNLFLHVALPVGLGIVLWVHVSRVARPTLLPPRRLTVAITLLLVGLAVGWPLGMDPPADLHRLPGRVPLDLFFGFWVPLARAVPNWATLGVMAAVAIALLAVPLAARPKPERRPPPSVVDERLCTGCVQCSLDCPWEAITMLPRTDGRAELVARVDPERCVSCGICAGSCAPMGVGPPGRTGRDQLGRLRADDLSYDGGVVVVACQRGAAAWGEAVIEGAPVRAAECVGNLHTSVVEQILKAGAAGVLVLGCPPRDCWGREGGKWAQERFYHDREAELHRRVDRRRVRLEWVAAGEKGRAREQVRLFSAVITSLDRGPGLEEVEPVRECEPVPFAEVES